MKSPFLLFLVVLLSACQREPERLFSLLSSDLTGVDFNNKIVENDFENLVDYSYVYNGGGVAVGDINNDGLPDLYFTGNQVDDQLYINITKPGQEIQFENITQKAGIKSGGWSTGVTMADVNSDGLLDIYVSRSGNRSAAERQNLLYLNQGNNQFEERAVQFGIADTSYTNQAAFFDYDKDGDLDLFLITSTNLDRNPNKLVKTVEDGTGLSADILYKNNGDNTYTDVSIEAGILHDGMSLGLSITDFNDDGWEDIFVGNDFLANDLLYINNQDGTFTESAKSSFAHHSQFSMGNDFADINNDGLMDLISVDMLPADNEQRKKMAGPANFLQFEQSLRLGIHPQFMRNMLFVNQGNIKTKVGQQHITLPQFSEIGQFASVFSTDWSWSPLFADFDNDGLTDLYITNGYLRDVTDLDFVAYNVGLAEKGVKSNEIDQHMKDGAKTMATLKKQNFFYKNTNGTAFEDVTIQWSSKSPSLSNGAAYADLDNDGDLDIIANNINEKAFILKNNSQPSPFLKVELKGNTPNIQGIGTVVKIYSHSGIQTQTKQPTKGFQSAINEALHFGLGTHTVDSVEVIWPNFKTQVLTNIPPHQALTFEQSNAKPKELKPLEAPTLFQDVSEDLNLNFVHTEVPYLDFNQEPLLPHKLSYQGPKLATGDMNGDGLEDFFMGGSYHHSGQIFIQQPNGKFSVKPLIQNELEKDEEDIGVALFDIENDGDLDLYLVSGSNEYFDNSPYYQDRLYINDGKGNFTRSPQALPNIRHSGTCVAVGDFDHDGYTDIFRGGGAIPLAYPKASPSYLLKNNKGVFQDVTQTVAPELAQLGIVKDAVWADINQDKKPDLVIVGHWAPIRFFVNQSGKLSSKTELANSNGFWNCIKGADMDGDGDLDFVVGNRGKNERFKPSLKTPLTIYGNDFDQNGKWDAITTYYLGGVEYPVASRDEIVRHVPLLRKKFQNYSTFSKATIQEVLDRPQRDASVIFKAYEANSMYIENVGDGRFKMHPLPEQVQWSVVQDLWITDFNDDQILDILLVGNEYVTEPVSGQIDASYGNLLLGDKKGNFSVVPNRKTGIWAKGDCRSIVSITSANHQNLYVIARNGASLMTFTPTKPQKNRK